jgi:teichuronic acid biosynthesis glycosyltransferase TuaH
VNRVLVLGTADWNQPIATNQHYVVREMAKEFRVLFTESMGLRAPEISIRDMRRIATRLLSASRVHRTPSGRPIPSGVEIRSPRILPRHTGLSARFNAPRMRSLVHDWIAGQEPRLLWTYSPVTYGLERHAQNVIYHCVDLLGQVEGIPSDLIHSNERRLSSAGARAIGTSPVVVEHLRRMGFRDVQLWPNVADTGLISAARPEHVTRSRGRAVFAGNLSANKVDFALLNALAAAGVDLHLAGPISEGGGNAAQQVADLVAHGAVYHGILQPLELAELYWTAQVGLIPYAINEYTRGVSPLKTFEYLAAGLSVVSTPIPSVQPISHSVEVVDNGPAYVNTVTSRLNGHVSDASAADRLAIAERNSWFERGKVIRDLVRLATGTQ